MCEEGCLEHTCKTNSLYLWYPFYVDGSEASNGAVPEYLVVSRSMLSDCSEVVWLVLMHRFTMGQV